MEIDKRITDLKLAIRKISELASKIPDCIRFDIGQPDFDTPQHIKQAAIEAVKEGFTGYTSTFGIPELRKAVAERESEDKDLDISESNVLITQGGSGALVTSFLSILKPGDEVIIPNPFWSPYNFQIVSAHGKPVSVNYFENGEVIEENIEKSITNRTKIILVNTPENPTGRVYKKKDLEKIADIANNHDLFVISDEVYDKLVFGNVKHYSIASIIPERTLLVNSCSKTYAMTGWRVGWLIAKEEFIPEIMKMNRATIACVNSIAQKAALAALTSDQSCVEEMRREYERRRDFAVKKLKEMGLEFINPQGAFYVFPDVGRNSWSFALDLIEREKVSVVPGIPFGSAGKGHVRIALTVGVEKIEEGLKRIENFLKT